MNAKFIQPADATILIKEASMPKKISFTMHDPDGKKHSTRFNFEGLEQVDGEDVPLGKALSGELRRVAMALQSTSFYIPKPIAEECKRIRITIEEL
jgi:hypothetical protein